MKGEVFWLNGVGSRKVRVVRIGYLVFGFLVC